MLVDIQWDATMDEVELMVGDGRKLGD